MKKVAKPIVSLAGKSENKLISLVSFTVGGISSFLQNIGAAALFLPAIRRICRDSKIQASRLLMPMGFAAILGGTLTMVGSGPLILLNDLLKQADLKSYSLFGSTPVGIVLLATGVLYFVLIGKRLLPRRSPAGKSPQTQRKLIDTFNLNSIVHLMRIPASSSLGKASLACPHFLFLLRTRKINIAAHKIFFITPQSFIFSSVSGNLKKNYLPNI